MGFLKFDENQLEAVKTDVNTVVVAGAGAGKTSVLAARFIWLLKEKKVNIDQILCLTFTNKAAAEMQAKIFKALEEEELEEALASLHKAQISTIDSFSTMIAREASRQFGLSEDFVINNQQYLEIVERAATDFYFNNSDNEALKKFTDQFGFNKVLEGFFIKLAKSFLTIALKYDFKEILEAQFRELDKNKDNYIEELVVIAKGLLNSQFLKYKKIKDKEFTLNKITKLPELLKNGAYKDIVEIFNDLGKINSSGLRDTEEHSRLKDLIGQLKGYVATLKDIFLAYLQKNDLQELSSLLNNFQEQLHSVQRQKQIVTFRDVAQMAVSALRNDCVLRNYYKKKYRYILIDEFQDNNHLQKELLFLLAEKSNHFSQNIPETSDLEPDKLFFVGDEKQSIYGFRGAEVDVFKNLKTDLSKNKGKTIELKRNYRSHPNLINFFNDIFKIIMANPTEDFEANFSELEAALNSFEPTPIIKVFWREASNEDNEDFSDVESEAFAIGMFIKNSVENKSLLILDGENKRAADWQDFAILFRSSGKQFSYERIFRRLGIPYSSPNIRTLFVEPPVNDIYALLACAIDPLDRIAYATLLRSPLVRLSDEGFLKVLLRKEPAFSPVDDLKDEDAERYEQGQKFYQCLKDMIGEVPLSQLLSQIWYNFGYRYHILAQSQAERYLEYFDYLFSLAVKAEERGQSPYQFLKWLKQNLGTYEKLEETDSELSKPGTVQLLTIHKAKGLEFPIVIIADLGNRGKQDEKNTPLFITKKFGPVINLGEGNYFSNLSAEEEKRREEAELKRLFYVACTRAKNHLIFSAVRPRRDFTKTLLGLLFTGLKIKYDQDLNEFKPSAIELERIEDLDHLALEKITLPNKNFSKEIYFNLPVIERHWTRTHFSVTELNELYNNSLAQARGEKIILTNSETNAYLQEERDFARWGELVHKIISLKIQGKYHQNSLPLNLVSGFKLEKVKLLLQKAEEIADIFLTSPTYKQLSSAEGYATEYPFLYKYYWEQKKQVVFIDGVIDLFYCFNDEIFLLDFKTDRVFYPYEYLFQLAFYSQVLKEISGKKINSFLYYFFQQPSKRLYKFEEELDINSILNNLFEISCSAP